MPKRRKITLSDMQSAARERHKHLINMSSNDLWDGFLFEEPPLVVGRKRDPFKIKEMMPDITPLPKKRDNVLEQIEFREVKKIDFTQIDRFKKKKPVLTDTPPKVIKEPPVVPDEKVIITRPPAVYSNSSPYGIASDLLMNKETKNSPG